MARQDAVGTAFFRVNGELIRIAGEMRIMGLREKRTPLIGLDGSVAVQTEFMSPMVECQGRDHATAKILEMFDMHDVSVTVEMANGTVWSLSNAFYAGDGDIDAREGTYQIRFHGSSIRRIK